MCNPIINNQHPERTCNFLEVIDITYFFIFVKLSTTSVLICALKLETLFL